MSSLGTSQYKHEALKDYLVKRIRSGEYSSKSRIDSESLLCEQFEVSRNTVRQALKELEREGYCYRVRGKGTFVRDVSPDRSRKIALLINDAAYVTHPVTAGLINGIDEVLAEQRYVLDILASNRTYHDERVARLSKSYAGLLIGAYQVDEMLLDELQRASIPCLFVKNYRDEFRGHAARIDFEAAGFLLAEHLIKRGRTNLALINGSDEIAIARDFKAGVRNACLEHGAKLRSENIVVSEYGAVAEAVAAAKRFAAQAEMPDGVICSTDEQAMALCSELGRLDIAIPRDVAVVGCNNSELSAHFSPPLTTMEIPTVELGRQAAAMILKAVKNEPVEPVVVEPSLIVRMSS